LERSLQAAQIVRAVQDADTPLRAIRAVDAILEAYRMAQYEGNEPDCPECGPGAPGYVDDPNAPSDGDPFARSQPCSTCADAARIADQCDRLHDEAMDR